MRFFRQLCFKARSLLRHDEKQDDLDEEIEAHIELLAEEYLSQGMNPRAARRAAGSLASASSAARANSTQRRRWSKSFSSIIGSSVQGGQGCLARASCEPSGGGWT